MATTLTHRFSAADYFRMAESGILPPDARVELIGGEIIDMSPIGPFHSASVNELNRQFSMANSGGWWLSIQAPLDLGPHDLPEPDLALLRPAAHRYREAHPRAEDVILLVEVSDSSLDFDRAVKLPLYARHGIPEVWILNAPQLRLEVHRCPGPEGYTEVAHHRDGAVAPEAFPDAAIDLGQLLG